MLRRDVGRRLESEIPSRVARKAKSEILKKSPSSDGHKKLRFFFNVATLARLLRGLPFLRELRNLQNAQITKERQKCLLNHFQLFLA